jgi:hypothetical protein
VPEIIDPVFAKTSQNARFLLSENERFGLVFVKTGSINSGPVEHPDLKSVDFFLTYTLQMLSFTVIDFSLCDLLALSTEKLYYLN